MEVKYEIAGVAFQTCFPAIIKIMLLYLFLKLLDRIMP